MGVSQCLEEIECCPLIDARFVACDVDFMSEDGTKEGILVCNFAEDKDDDNPVNEYRKQVGIFTSKICKG